MADIVALALRLIQAREDEMALRMAVLNCHRNSDHVLFSAFEFAHRRAGERRARAAERLRAVRLELGEVHAPP